MIFFVSLPGVVFKVLPGDPQLVKNSITRLSALVLTLFIAAFAVPAQTAQKQPARRTEPVRTQPVKKATTDSIQSDLKEALSVIEGNYVGGTKLDYNEVFKNSIDTMLRTLDPHSNYFDAKEFQEFMTEQRSQYFGIGATIGDLSGPDGKVIATYIKATFDDAPAHKAGLRYGDKIVRFSGPRVQADGTISEVKDESLLGKSYPEVRSYLRGPEGTTIQLTVEKLATGKEETVSITRGAVSQPSISEIYIIRPGIGYMAMAGGFNQTTADEFEQGLRYLKSMGATQFVLDLRDNGGGLVHQAYRIADMFLNYGQLVFTQKGRVPGANETRPAENRNPDRSPLVLLVNRGTASASEILAGAMQDHDRGLIVGENTFGKGLVQMPMRMEYGTMLLLTIAKYQTPSGRQIQRDYSNGDFYAYITERENAAGTPATTRTKGAERQTDTGRTVYGGGGITPDVEIKREDVPIERLRTQAKIANPIIAFAMDVVSGKVKGFDKYRVDTPINFDHDVEAGDFPITEQMYRSFRAYAADKYKTSPALIDRERSFVERLLRSEFVTAAYGSVTSGQIANEYDDQLKKAIDLLPEAKQLAQKGEKARLAGNRAN